jgi:hypothetical protein
VTRLLGVGALALAAFLAPLLASRYGGSALGHPLFDAPWLALQFANVMVGGALLAVAGVIAVQRLRPDWRGLPACAAVALASAAFGLALALKMDSGVSSDVMFFGLLPASDAQNYYSGAMAYLTSGQLTEWTTRRPFAALQLAGLFTFTGDGLRRTVMLLSGACAASALLVLTTLYRRLGSAGAVAAFASLFAFIHLTLGTTMSENLGFALGCAAFVLLAEAAMSGRRTLALIGLAVLSCALVTRAGALFVLPALALWCGWRFRNAAGAMSWRMVLSGLAAGTAGFAINKTLVIFAGAPGQLAFGNFAFTLYGLAIGGESWTRFFTDFPQYLSVGEGEQAVAAYHAALTHIRSAPFDLIKGIGARYNDFLINSGWHKYVPNMLLRALVLLLAVIGVVACWRTRGANLSALLLAGLAGMLLSVPFLGDGGSRVYAATHPFSAAFVAVGAYVVQRWLTNDTFAPASPFAAAPPMAIAFSCLLLAPVLVAIAHAPRAIPTAAQPCPEGSARFSGRIPAIVTICPAGAVDCVGLRAQSVRATNIWKNPLMNRLADEAPLQIGLALSPVGVPAWVTAQPATVLPRGLASFCLHPDPALPSLAAFAP